ncbi:tRNA dimethylallyltransferase [Pseudobutyrivibrio sp. NOR37]|uniref:tRNA dimethylallyltransferase n=1 Tax=Pseudobutyrivibrio xylanivorans TaxID=185007 RepID=A0A6M0LFC6_PSEXY|nr:MULTISPECIES: tRNA (adenosine(37)-N6)-dimethylallyltransferase MiaA [Pseudobutyrivibrio]NEX01166.1 tRNA (adenosine(37)-N6)-dimethylallyltransferase MiaA [Pseudobutyrivibrio xylanivorans]SFR65487.1 tRNA dimethylallyltransferase [Pseudobutyrivibrio sp. NOR37]
MKNLVILTGPTAVGKTALSINLAKAINGEIISADSMQVYKKMDIGTAKVTPEEMDGVKHYLIDAIEPTEDFHVVRFQKMVLEAMDEIYSKGKIPIICGGTGFYIQAILYDIQFTEQEIDESYRKSLEDYANEFGNQALHSRLNEVDPESASTIPEANRKRVIRAIEYFHQTGEKFSVHNEREKQRTSPYNFAYFVLNDDRGLLYNRIDKRVDIMMKAGLLDEVKMLLTMGCKPGMTSMDGIGYKEIISYLDGNISLEDSIELIKKNSRNYAKRQLTWFRREKEVTWLDKTVLKDDRQLLDYILSQLKEKGII